jgi:two-component system phosphate regulon sensor histidine kinase PhoR
MKKKTIQVIIALMSIALLGITIIQFVWLRRSIELNETNFNDRVTLALNRVKGVLEEDVNTLAYDNFFNQNPSSLFKKEDDLVSGLLKPTYKYNSEILKNQMGNTAWRLNPQLALTTITIKDLEIYLRKELRDQDITLDYDYGVFSNESESYLITNGNYVVTIGNNSQSSNGGDIRNLDRSSYQVPLFSLDGDRSAGTLRLFFPKKTTFLLSSVLPSLLSSLIFTGLVMFCFIYTISIILRQKKVSIMKTDFINNMTHEFKTPIATISLAVDSINSPMIRSKPDKIKRYADIIKQENSRMLKQVEKVLNIAQLDKQDFDLKLSPVNINDLVNQAVEHSALKVNQRGGVIKAILRAKQPVIRGDENHISNVIHNLLDNANKYSPDKPIITLTTEDHKDGVMLSIEDQGIGISKDELKRIFEKFYRVSTGNLHDVKGFGLGLSYVKAIMDAHKGKVDVVSDPGKGSKFTLIFPFNVRAIN